VEMHRTNDELTRQVAADFADWGIPTAESICLARRGAPQTTLIASGGIYTGIEMAKAIALGADAAALATPFLSLATTSAEAVGQKIHEIAEELRTAMFCIGAADLDALKGTPFLRPIDEVLSQ